MEDAGGKAGGCDDFGERVSRARHDLRRLEHDGVAVTQRRRNLPGRDRDRKIPWRDQADDADRLARDLDLEAGTHRGTFFSRQAHRLAPKDRTNLSASHAFPTP